MSRRGTRWGVPALACVVAALLASCQAGQATAPPGPHRDHGAVVVASFNFPESELLAAIYGLAIQHAGIPVRLELNLGPRELVQPAIEQGLVDLVPEYLGTALASMNPPGAQRAPLSRRAAWHALARAYARWHVRVMNPAPAQDQNGVAVTRATAARLHLRTVSDLRRVSPRLSLGGPPECPRRPYCLPGLQQVYGLRFARFRSFGTEEQRVLALVQNVVSVAIVFTTDGNLAGGDLVLLSDDLHLQQMENVVPVVTGGAVARYGTRLTGAINAVSARLTTSNLVFLNWRVEVAGKNVLAEARAWLERHGLLPR